MQVYGGTGSTSGGGSGTAYSDCGEVGTALIMDANGHGLTTYFLESNDTTWHFDHLGVFGSMTFAFSPSLMGVVGRQVTVSVGTALGDQTGTLQIADGVKFLLHSRPEGGSGFAVDSNYQQAVGAVLSSTGSGVEYVVGWQRVYYIADHSATFVVNVDLEAGGELTTPPRMVVQGVTLEIEGVVDGLEELAVGEGGHVHFYATGRSSNRSAGGYALQAFVMDGITDAGVVNALVTMNHGVTLEAQSLQLVHGTLQVHGQTSLEAQLLNLTAGASIDGAGKSDNGVREGPGIYSASTSGGAKRYAASHGGISGGWGSSAHTCERRERPNPDGPRPRAPTAPRRA